MLPIGTRDSLAGRDFVGVGRLLDECGGLCAALAFIADAAEGRSRDVAGRRDALNGFFGRCCQDFG
jgi:hypothetical protein